jgi:hypothetical protein
MPIFMYLISCIDGSKSEGTIVGNPGKVNTIIADSESFVYEDGGAFLESITYVKKRMDNSFEELTVDVDDEIDLVAVGGSFEVQKGNWDSIHLEFHDFYLEGGSLVDENQIDFVLSLEFMKIPLKASESVVIEEETYVLEMGQPDYFADVILEEFSDDFDFVEISDDNDETSELLDLAYDQMEGQSTLFEDLDENGQVDAEERAFPVATADEEEVASGNVGSTSDGESQEESSEDTVTDQSPEEEDMVDENESYSYNTGCSDSNLTMAIFPLVFFLGRRRKSKSTNKWKNNTCSSI